MANENSSSLPSSSLTNPPAASSLITLPNEIIILILAHVPPADIIHVFLVNKHMTDVITSLKQQIITKMVNTQFAIGKLFFLTPTFPESTSSATLSDDNESSALEKLCHLSKSAICIDFLIKRIIKSLTHQELEELNDLVDVLTAGFYAWFACHSLFKETRLESYQLLASIQPSLFCLIRFTSTELAKCMAREGRELFDWETTLLGPRAASGLEEMVLYHGFEVLQTLVDNSSTTVPAPPPLDREFLRGMGKRPTLSRWHDSCLISLICGDVGTELTVMDTWTMTSTRVLLCEYWNDLGFGDTIGAYSTAGIDHANRLIFTRCKMDVGAECFTEATSRCSFRPSVKIFQSDEEEREFLEMFVTIPDRYKFDWEVILYYKICQGIYCGEDIAAVGGFVPWAALHISKLREKQWDPLIDPFKDGTAPAEYTGVVPHGWHRRWDPLADYAYKKLQDLEDLD